MRLRFDSQGSLAQMSDKPLLTVEVYFAGERLKLVYSPEFRHRGVQ